MATINKRPDGKYRARYRDDCAEEHARHFERKGSTPSDGSMSRPRSLSPALPSRPSKRG